jgi:hypothetical protein
MNDSDKILFHQWIISEDANEAFIVWKTKQLESLAPLAVPHPKAPKKSHPNAQARNKGAPPKKKTKSEEIVLHGGTGFSGPIWDEHVRSCQKTGRDPYD